MIKTRMKINKLKFGQFITRRRAKITEVRTQAMLAEKLNVAVTTITKIETGERLPSFELFIDLADALQMTPGDLMMVMAEREDGNKNYMEMSEWLIKRLETLVTEYHTLTDEPATTSEPEQLFPFTPNSQAKATMAEIDERIKKANPKPPSTANEDIEVQEQN